LVACWAVVMVVPATVLQVVDQTAVVPLVVAVVVADTSVAVVVLVRPVVSLLTAVAAVAVAQVSAAGPAQLIRPAAARHPATVPTQPETTPVMAARVAQQMQTARVAITVL
jgi:hypothetical protein